MALKETIDNNPVATAGVAATVTAAVILLATRAGIVFSDDEAETIGEIIVLILPVIAAWWARRHVVGPSTFKSITGQDVEDI